MIPTIVSTHHLISTLRRLFFANRGFGDKPPMISRRKTCPPSCLGFTLVELLIVLAIIGIVSSIAMPAYSSFANAAKEATAKATLGKIALALEKRRQRSNHYQSNLRELEIPDSDAWFRYTIENPSQTKFSAYAFPLHPAAGLRSYRLDHTGNQLVLEHAGDGWTQGWH